MMRSSFCVKQVSQVAALAASLVFSMVFSVQAFADLTERDQPKFEKKKIKIGDRTVIAEIADTDEKREFGLMYRKALPKNEGMLFIFDNSQALNFWMKNTLIPLSIGYFDENRNLLEIHEMKPQVMGEREMRTYPSHAPAKYALEMPANWFRTSSIRSGVIFTFVGKP